MTLDHRKAKELIGGLLKEISSTKHWSLIFANVDKANTVSRKSGDFESVDCETAIGRLKDICSVHIDKNQFEHLDKLRKLPNVAVHFA